MARKKIKIKKKNLVLTVIVLLIISIGTFVVYSYLNTDRNLNNGSNIIKKVVDKITEKQKKVEIIDVNSNLRPYAVMINNVDAVWDYQSGLNDAYLVYEMLAEGGIPREMAVFQSRNVAKIQSIRSSRHYYIDYALENDAVYVHWGWSPQAQQEISYTGIDGISINNLNGLAGEGVYFYRDSSVNAAYEHTGYTTGEYIQKGINDYGYRNTTDKKPLLSYSVDSLDLSKYGETKEAKNINIKFSGYYTANFIYNEKTKFYEKSQNNYEMYDYASGKRVFTKNIIVYDIGYSNIPGDAKGRLTVDNIGSGSGYFITEGKAIPITWEKTGRSSRTQYKFVDGSELIVNDGRTFIELIPHDGTIVME